MSEKHITPVADFDTAVAEYKKEEEKVTQDFLQGVIKLGEILQRQRDVWKPLKRWTDYLTSIDRTMASANQFIRIYEYSVDHMKKLMKANLTNWNKLNMFLALPEALREKVAEKLEGEDVTTDKFAETISEVKGDEDVEVVVEDELPIEDDKLAEQIKASTLVDISFMAKTMVKELRKLGNEFSDNCIPVAEGFLGLERALRDLKSENMKKLTSAERKFWKKLIIVQIDKLDKLIK